MKTKIQITLVALAVAFMTGCASSSKPKPVYERGWIGSDFQKATRDLRPKGERAGVYLRQTYPNTPAAQAGLQPADLVLAVDGTSITRLQDFRTRVDAAKPGQVMKITALRSGERVEVPVTVGRERYQNWHTFAMGLGWTSKLDILPTPDFNLLPLASFQRETRRLELNSPETILRRNGHKRCEDTSEGTSSHEGWSAWLALFGVGKHKAILSQETVEPLRAQR